MLPHGRYNSTKPVSKFCCDIGFTIHFVVHQMSRNIFCGSKDCTKKNWVKLFATMLKRCFEILSTPFFATTPHRFQHLWENSDETLPLLQLPNGFTRKDFQRYHATMAIWDVTDGRLLPWTQARARKISRDYLLQELPVLKRFLKTVLTDKVSHQCLAFFFFFFFLFLSPLKKQTITVWRPCKALCKHSNCFWNRQFIFQLTRIKHLIYTIRTRF